LLPLVAQGLLWWLLLLLLLLLLPGVHHLLLRGCLLGLRLRICCLEADDVCLQRALRVTASKLLLLLLLIIAALG
jgi:hypothetical protein